jgi:hypothetical protein
MATDCQRVSLAKSLSHAESLDNDRLDNQDFPFIKVERSISAGSHSL